MALMPSEPASSAGKPAVVLTAANLITLVRLILTGVFIALVLRGSIAPALAVFAVAWGLDAVDGYVARRWHQETRLGFILDKAVDRLLIITAVLVLVGFGVVPGYALALLSKDVVALPALLLELSRRQPISALRWGKFATLLQGSALLWVAVGLPYSVIIVAAVAAFGTAAGVVHLHDVLKEPK